MFVEKETTTSTNDDARALALEGAPHGAMVLARAQTAGRGRAGRGFVSPAGGLYVSVVVRPKAPAHAWSPLPLVAGAAMASALRERGFPAELKWPNDVLLSGRKVGGVLVETRLDADPFAIVGIGVNLTAPPSDLPHATALAAHGRPPDARELALAFRDALVARVARLDAHGPSRVMPEVRSLCGTLGRRVVWEKGEGVAVDVTDDGALVMEMEGVPTLVHAGDVSLRAG